MLAFCMGLRGQRVGPGYGAGGIDAQWSYCCWCCWLSSGASLLPTRNVLSGVYWLGDNKQRLQGFNLVAAAAAAAAYGGLDSPVQAIDADAKYTRIAEAGEARLADAHQAQAKAERQEQSSLWAAVYQCP